MKVTIYLDLILILDYLVNFYVLFITGYIIRQRISIIRIGLGALFGTLAFLPFMLCPKLLVGLSGIILTIGISMGAVMISFGIRYGLIKKWLLSTTIMFLLGGMIQFAKGKLRVVYIGFYKWLIIFLFCMMAGTALFLFLSANKDKGKYIRVIKISQRERIVEEQVFVDSGNRLLDLLYRKPVLILSKEVVKRLVSREEYEYIDKCSRFHFLDYSDPTLIKMQKSICIHELPYKSVGRISGKMLCFVVDSVEVVGSNKYYKKQPIAVADDRLFNGKNYKGLIFPDES